MTPSHSFSLVTFVLGEKPRAEPVSRRFFLGLVLVPLILLAVVTAIFYWTSLDAAVTGPFFSESGNPFPYRETTLASVIFDYGPMPAIVFGVLCIAVYLVSFVWSVLQPFRRGALFCTLAILIGPGILINGILKPSWGRPRPCDTVLFGGHQQYIPPGTIGPYEGAKSFPSGHASMGFVFLIPAFLLFAQRRRMAFALLGAGIAFGGVIGASRIAEGGHFLSDIVWSGAIVYFTGLTLYAIAYGWNSSNTAADGQAESRTTIVPFAYGERDTDEPTSSAA